MAMRSSCSSGYPTGRWSSRGSSARPIRARDILPFKTENYALPRVLALPGRPALAPGEAEALAKIVSRGPHFALPLRKRSDSEALYADRISVGRARNKDIVLRHSSISKFHAWFESDAEGLLVADADSKNLTRLNGERLSPSEKVRVRSGDVVRFGAIDCVLCSPSVLWTSLHPAASRPERHGVGGS